MSTKGADENEGEGNRQSSTNKEIPERYGQFCALAEPVGVDRPGCQAPHHGQRGEHYLQSRHAVKTVGRL